MPRRVDPHWGEDGFDEANPFTLTQDQEQDLAAMVELTPDSPEGAALRSDIEDIGTQYRNWAHRGARAFSRAEARQALEDILKRQTLDYPCLTALNERAFQYVHDALLMMKPAPAPRVGTVFSALVEGQIEEDVLRSAVKDAIERLKAIKGPDREGEIAWTVAELCRLYEEVTGKPATHSNKGELLGYESGPQSPAGKFVQACFALIDTHVRDTQISQAMRHHIEAHR